MMRDLFLSALLFFVATSPAAAQAPEVELLRPPPPPPPPPSPPPPAPDRGLGLIGGVELGLAMRARTAPDRVGLVFGGRTGLVWLGEDMSAGLIVDVRYEHGPARFRAQVGPLIGAERAQFSGGYVLEFRDGERIHGVGAELALSPGRHPRGGFEPFWRLTRLFPDTGDPELIFTLGLRAKMQGSADRRRPSPLRLDQDPTVGILFLTRIGDGRPEGWLARIQATTPLFGLAAGLGFQRTRLQGEEGRGASLDLAGRFSFVGLLARAWPELLRWVDVNAEVGVEVGGMSAHGFRGALWAGGTLDLRASRESWMAAPTLQVGYRYHILRWPSEAPEHQILIGVGLAGVGL